MQRFQMSGIFGSLPEVEKCCYCWSLRCGAVTIIVITWLLCIGVWSAELFTKCDPVKDILPMIFYWAFVAATAALAFSGIVFLVGICMDREITAKIFLWTGLVFLLIYIASAVGLVIKGEGCMNNMIRLGGLGPVIILFIYFAIVVKSFAYQEMDD